MGALDTFVADPFVRCILAVGAAAFMWFMGLAGREAIAHCHRHRWVRTDKISTFRPGAKPESYPIQIDFVLTCETCGRIKTVRA